MYCSQKLGEVLQKFVAFSKYMKFKVHIFWEGHKILQNLHLTFDYSTYSQKLGEDFAKFLWPSQNIWTLTLILFFFFQVRMTFKVGSVGLPIKFFWRIPLFLLLIDCDKIPTEKLKKTTKSIRGSKMQMRVQISITFFGIRQLLRTVEQMAVESLKIPKKFITIWFLRSEFYREFNKNYGADGFG